MRIGSFYIEDKYHRYLYLASLIFVLFSLPFYRAMSSIGMIVMASNWLLEGHFNEKWQRLKHNPGIWIFSSFYFVGVFSFFYSDNTGQVMKHMQNSLALLAAPLVIGTSRPVSYRDLKILIGAMTVGVVINSFISYALFTGIIKADISDFRHYSYFSSNIHVSYIAVMAMIFIYYHVTRKWNTLPANERRLLLSLMVWMGLYVVFLRSLSGLMVFGAFIWIVLFLKSRKWKAYIKIPVIVALIVLPLLPVALLYHIYQQNFTDYKVDVSELPQRTERGNQYKHNLKNPTMENGRYVGLFISEKELEKSWNQRSSLAYEGKDEKGQPLHMTLKRYLTAKGLRKDARGVQALSEKDIHNVESGITNPVYADKKRFFTSRLYTVAQGLHQYLRTGRPFDSITQRMEAYPAMIHIISENFWIGVGRGDIYTAHDEYYAEKFKRPGNFKLVAGHNQYLKTMTSFGVIGLAWMLIAVFGSWYVQGGFRFFLSRMILLMLLLTMIPDEPFEQQLPAILFSVLLSIVLFRNNVSGTGRIPLHPD